MEQKNNDIALVVIDAVLPGVEEDKDIALSRIQKLIDEGVSIMMLLFLCCSNQEKQERLLK